MRKIYSFGLSMLRVVLIFLVLFSPALFSQDIPVKLGDERVTIHVEKNGPGKVFLHVHQSETTALKAARSVIKTQGGTVITLKHSGHRNIVFKEKGARYEFDPNRMFTDAGIKKTLSTFGPYSTSAHQQVKTLATKLMAVLPKGKVIAVHNNKHYSLKDYLPGHPLEKDAKNLSFDHKNQYRNFYLVTKAFDYKRLGKYSFNRILQAQTAADDGSLSVRLSDKPYINVEAGYNQLVQQIKMLEVA